MQLRKESLKKSGLPDFFRLSFRNCISCVNNCEDLLYTYFFIPVSIRQILERLEGLYSDNDNVEDENRATGTDRSCRQSSLPHN